MSRCRAPSTQLPAYKVICLTADQPGHKASVNQACETTLSTLPSHSTVVVICPTAKTFCRSTSLCY